MGTTHVTDGAMVAKIGQVRSAGERLYDTDRPTANLLLAVAAAAGCAHRAQIDAEIAVDSDPDDMSARDELACVTAELMRWGPVFTAALAVAHTGHTLPMPYCPRCLATERALPVLHDVDVAPCVHPWHTTTEERTPR